ncbi:MAG: hypothetical protein U0232_25910 [Thermomicrobiales bacterium]
MIEIRHERPQNTEHFSNLLAFYREILPICRDLQLSPLLTGSLAVFAYTRNQSLPVNDLDLACAESAFPRLTHALAIQGITTAEKSWHVLQAHRDHLKIEFDSLEFWFADVPTAHDTLIIDGCPFNLLCLSSLQELYRRGLNDVAQQNDASSRAKYASIATKYALLCAI